MDNLDKNLQQSQSDQLSNQERNQLKRELKEQERKKERTQEQRKRLFKRLLIAVSVVVLVGGIIALIGWFIASRTNLPPTDMQGHIEENPKAHIVTEPIPINIQRHMLEHADGKTKPGIIIQYNCKKYVCQPDLITKLTELVKQYPDNVYLGPNNYDGKIILTKMGKIQVLDNFDEQAIKDFIK